jgi:hypothetical protein
MKYVTVRILNGKQVGDVDYNFASKLSLAITKELGRITGQSPLSAEDVTVVWEHAFEHRIGATHPISRSTSRFQIVIEVKTNIIRFDDTGKHNILAAAGTALALNVRPGSSATILVTFPYDSEEALDYMFTF